MVRTKKSTDSFGGWTPRFTGGLFLRSDRVRALEGEPFQRSDRVKALEGELCERSLSGSVGCRLDLFDFRCRQQPLGNYHTHGSKADNTRTHTHIHTHNARLREMLYQPLATPTTPQLGVPYDRTPKPRYTTTNPKTRRNEARNLAAQGKGGEQEKENGLLVTHQVGFTRR
jgi:hypothetical protein